MALVLNYQTPAQFAARLRQRYRNSSRDESCRLAGWMLDKLEAGDVTDAQLRAVFGLTVTQWNALKSKFLTMRTNYDSTQAAAGE